MIYRIANTNDVQEIIEMKERVKKRIIDENLPIWLNGYPESKLIIEDIANKMGRVVTSDDGEIVAYACFHHASIEYPKKTFQKDNLQSFERVMVKDEYLGKHYGSFLVANLIKEASFLNVDGVGILVDATNQKALRLYKKYGFIKEGSREFSFAYLDIYTLYFK